MSRDSGEQLARVAAVMGCALTLFACSGGVSGDVSDVGTVPDGATSVAASVGGGPVLPAGWRWEGFGGVMVAVPGDWGWDNGSQRLGQWCVQLGARPPIVGRPGPSTQVGCPTGADGVDPSTLVANTGVVVAFDWAIEDAPLAAQGDQESRRVGDTIVRVNAPVGLRRQILGTIHEAEVDANGCPMALSGSFEPGTRPRPARDIATLTGVKSVTACRYPLRPLVETSDARPPAPLFSSVRLDMEAAQDAVAAIAAAPLGGGPDKPEACLPDFSYGDEMIIAHIESDEGESTVHVYYSGCDHNGLDDGIAVRALTRPAVQPLIAAPNQPLMWGGPDSKRRILIPEEQ